MGDWKYGSTILDLDTRCRWVVSFKPLPLYHRWKYSRCPLDKRSRGSQTQSGHYGVEKKLTLVRSWTPAVQLVPHRYTDWVIPAFLLSDILSYVWVFAWLIGRVLDWMIGFVDPSHIHTLRDYRQYTAIVILHTFQFSVTHTLVFSVFTGRILATDLS
jgi:hypothetical protein